MPSSLNYGSSEGNHFLKKYAVVADVSPSEQITGNPDALKTMGLVIGLRYYDSFERVGRKFDVKDQQLTLKKWSGSSEKYKCKFVEHLSAVVANGNIMCGVNVANERVVLGGGAVMFQTLAGTFPEPSSISKSGREMIMLGGYRVDGQEVQPFEVSKDDLCVMGWMVDAFSSLLKSLEEINEEKVHLDVLVDRLPNEKGGDNYHKATFLKDLLKKATFGRAELKGVPDPKIQVQRDLFVDNLAGLAAEAQKKPGSKAAKLLSEKSPSPIQVHRVATDWPPKAANS